MEFNTTYKKAYKRIERFRIAAGIIATLIAVFNTISCGLIISQYYFQYGLHMVTLPVSYLLAAIAAMVVFAIYVFVYYGKKSSFLLGVSAALMAGCGVLFIYWSVVYKLSSLPSLIFSIFIIAIYVVIALKYTCSKVNININIKALPTKVVIVLALFSRIIMGLGWVDMLIPFLLFTLFCPPTHKRVKINILPENQQTSCEK